VKRTVSAVVVLACLVTSVSLARAQSFPGHVVATPVPADVEEMYRKGLDYLVRTQSDAGTWQDGYGQQPGVVGLAVLAMLAHGDDPELGPFSSSIKRGIEFILKSQQADSGYVGSSMYNHGFATLALAEAYGCVTDARIGPALEKAVKLILSSQATNQMGAWRYSPSSQDADTTVSGACLVALFAARNAGVAVPDKAIEKALGFYRLCQTPEGGFGYTNPNGPNAPRSAIGTLMLALARERDNRTFKAALNYMRHAGQDSNEYHYYYLYYAAQAFFHSGATEWQKWNEINRRRLRDVQGQDGSWQGQHGATFSTSCALLSLALNYRFLPIYER